MVLDKTGTITKGEPEVTDILSRGELGSDQILRLAAIAEKRSEHPLGVAIFEKGKKEYGHLPDADRFTAIPGRGIMAVVAGKKIYLGTRKLMGEEKIDLGTIETTVAELENDGKTAKRWRLSRE